MASICTIDESTTGARTAGPVIQIDREELTLRELIGLRVRQEVARYNAERPQRFYGLVQPSDLEVMLNGPARREFKPVNAERQVELALKAFEQQRLIVLGPKGQVDSLDEPMRIGDGDEVSFLRLVPLIGG